MNNQNDRYICSPYLTKHPHLKGKLVNRLPYQIISLTDQQFEVLRYCGVERDYIDLVRSYGEEPLRKLIDKGLLLPSDRRWIVNKISKVEIETSTVCDWKCRYCPGAYIKREPKYMDMDFFEDILKKALDYGARFITLHGYNEPTIDPLFEQRVRLIKKYNLKLILFTNGSGLNDRLIQMLKDTNFLSSVVFNFPSADKDRLKAITGRDTLDKTCGIINKTICAGIRVKLSLQGTLESQRFELESVKKLFPSVEIITAATHDRAGALKNQYDNNLDIKSSHLAGCNFILTDFHIGIDGECYLCLEDSQKKYIMGNIKTNTIAEIVESDVAILLKKVIWGEIEAPKNFICRKCIIMKGAFLEEKLYNGAE